MRHELMGMKLLPPLIHLFRHECRVAAHFPKILAKVAKRVLQDMAAQVINPTRYVEALMHEVVPVPAPGLVETLRLPVVRVTVAVPDPPTHDKFLPLHEERLVDGTHGKL